MDKTEILKFIKDSIESLKKNDYGCCHYYLDDNFGIFVGWSCLQCTLVDPTVIHAKRSPEYVIAVGVKVRRPGDESDYDRLDFPWSSVDFCVINCFYPTPEMTDAECLKEVTMLLDAYQETVEAYKKGIVRCKYFD